MAESGSTYKPDSSSPNAVACHNAAEEEEEEHFWLPNPYQALADAQVLAGAWPGAAFYHMDMSPQQMTESSAFPYNSPGGRADGMGMCEMAPWVGNCCVYVSPGYVDGQYPQECNKAATGSTTDSTDSHHGDASPETPESALSSPGEFTSEADCSGESWWLQAVDAGEESTPDTVGRLDRSTRKLAHRNVPKNKDLSQTSALTGNAGSENTPITTLMIRNIPNKYTRSMLVEELDALDFKNEYDFVYLPIDQTTQWNVGYAFVNFKSPQVAVRCIQEVTNYTFPRFEHGSGKVAQVSIARIQGLERNLAYYSKTAVQSARIQTHRPLQLNAEQNEVVMESSRKTRRRNLRRKTQAYRRKCSTLECPTYGSRAGDLIR